MAEDSMTPIEDQAGGAGADAGAQGAALGDVPGRGVGDLLQAVVAGVGESLDLWSVDLWTFSGDADTLACRAYWCREASAAAAGDCVGAVVGLDQSHDLRRLVLAAEPVERHIDDRLSPADAAALAQRGFTTRIDVPLIAGAQVLGVLSLAETRTVRRLTPEERERLRGLSRLAAVALRMMELYEAESERSGSLLAILDAGRDMAASLEARATVAAAREEASRLLVGVPCEAHVVLRQDDGEYFRVQGTDDRDARAPASWRADALARQAAELRRAEQARTPDGRARLLVPLVAAGRSIGYLELTATMQRRFRDAEVELGSLLAAQVAAALDRARTVRALESRSATDTLTGLYSRWYFYERLYAEVARGRRYRQPLSLVLAELDGEEDLVASRGPEFRDAVLTAMARLLQNSLRDKVDVACRLGGGRFALLLPNTPVASSAAGLVAERVRRTVAETRLIDDELGPLGRFTMSLGLAGYPDGADDADELATLAEAKLAAARAAGGDRVEPPPPLEVEDAEDDAEDPEKGGA
jgi:diguanylate cyclase (GGDEF)-like protein